MKQYRLIDMSDWWFTLVLLPFLFLMQGCPSTTKQTRQTPKGPVFQLAAKSDIPSCMQFTDARSALSFCLPKESELHTLKHFRPSQRDSFEVRLAVANPALEIRLRKDPLPPDLPEGALSGAWLLRYAEVYARRRGVRGTLQGKRMLHAKHRRHLQVDDAVWAAFAIPQPAAHQWEEILVLSRQQPPTRYLLSIRMTRQSRQQSGAIRRFLLQFLKHMRMRRP
jgi:hypothetical protein